VQTDRSVEIFEKIFGADHPETLDARDILSTSTTPAATTVFDTPTLPALERSSLDIGWAGHIGGEESLVKGQVKTERETEERETEERETEEREMEERETEERETAERETEERETEERETEERETEERETAVDRLASTTSH